MTCPDTITAHYWIVLWMLDIAQIGFWIGMWELFWWLWRVATGRKRLTKKVDEE